jgi:hypothetical protein
LSFVRLLQEPHIGLAHTISPMYRESLEKHLLLPQRTASLYLGLDGPHRSY